MFNLNQIQVTDADIAKVEQHFGFSFNDEQKTVIRTWETKNIQACPGSGKTTTLAAKLMILSENLPKSFQQGICIITHTNTAVDEIKKKLGTYANFYNNYPHHFGTIQSFVDKYLAIPAYKIKFPNQPIKIVDTDTYCKELDKFNSLNGTKIVFSQRGIDFLGTLSFNIIDFSVAKSIVSDKIILNRISAEKMKEHYDKVYDAKLKLLKQGFVKYDEAYSIAFGYLRKNPQFVNLFSKRFPIVFIDEMQDMETHQSKLINDLFGNGNTIVQKIGDINQSIFSPFAEQEQSDWDTTNSLSLNRTTRLSHHLAEIVKPICLKPQTMEGSWNPYPLIKPAIIIFDDSTKERVKEKFVELIIQNQLHELPNPTFKAVGQVKYNERLGVRSYWEDFNKNTSVKTREDFDNLFSYLEKCQVLSSEKNVKEIRKTLLNGICKALKLAEIKNPLTNYYFTPFTFTQYFLSEKETESKQLNLNLSKWILNFRLTTEIRTEIADYIKLLLDIFQKQTNLKLNMFLTDTTPATQTQQEPKQVYEYQGIQVHFDTIHGVKGETHTSTLYLETYNKMVFDIGGKILPFILSPQRPDGGCKKRLPFAYVAMSRATHLLCLAVHTDRFKDGVKDYFEEVNNNWRVIIVS